MDKKEKYAIGKDQSNEGLSRIDRSITYYKAGLVVAIGLLGNQAKEMFTEHIRILPWVEIFIVGMMIEQLFVSDRDDD